MKQNLQTRPSSITQLYTVSISQQACEPQGRQALGGWGGEGRRSERSNLTRGTVVWWYLADDQFSLSAGENKKEESKVPCLLCGHVTKVTYEKTDDGEFPTHLLSGSR